MTVRRDNPVSRAIVVFETPVDRFVSEWVNIANQTVVSTGVRRACDPDVRKALRSLILSLNVC
jgi:hypothetical protein